jgi:sugar phosphate isomerase/epimerase
MRLGGSMYRPKNVTEIDDVISALDTYGLSVITGPAHWADMTDDEAAAYGERARQHGLLVGETHHRPNLMNRDPQVRAERIEILRRGLRKADVMGCKAVTLLVGTIGPEDHLAAPHPYMFTAECRAEFREVILRAMDGLDLRHTKLLIEPWTNTFFYQPTAIREFLDSVGHPSVGLHLDQMNMVDQAHYYRTTELINETFDLLEPYIGGVHFKDVRWDWHHMLLKFDEVLIGDGVLDYPTYLARVAKLDPDIACYCEHLETEGEYAVNYARLHHLARELGTGFLRRPQAAPAAAA